MDGLLSVPWLYSQLASGDLDRDSVDNRTPKEAMQTGRLFLTLSLAFLGKNSYKFSYFYGQY